jgi:hypothetical protein
MVAGLTSVRPGLSLKGRGVSAAGGSVAGVEVNAETMLMPGIDLPHDDADLVLVCHRRMEIFEIGHGGRFERRLFKEPSVVAVHVPGVNTELAGITGELGHVMVSCSS